MFDPEQPKEKIIVNETNLKNVRYFIKHMKQIAMYVFRELTELSYPAIAREFGGRDHTTVIHAVDKISTLMPAKQQIYDDVTDLVQTIRSGK